MNDNRYIIAIDIGGTKTNLAFFIKKKINKIINFKTLNYGPDNIEKIIKILNDAQLDIVCICLSLTGLVDRQGYWSPINKKTLGNFQKYPVIKKLKKIFRVPVYALGDTQAAALGELYFGNGRNFNDFFYLTVSTGIGGSIIKHKNLYDGKISDIGAIGHTVIKFNGKICGCGKRGCLEAYASGNSLIKRINIKNCKNTKSLLTKFQHNKKTIKLVDEATSMIVQSILNINSLIRLNNFIIGGSVGLNSFFYQKLQKNLRLASNSIILKKAKLKSKPELYGCLMYVIKNYP